MTTPPPLQAYRVGGCVRDALLGMVVTDRDWVVVGETTGTMLARGFRQVGSDFPVFLHPETREEYALARRERKTGPGYKGFVTETARVTLEEDLARRDLTINAMALTADQRLIDPFGGEADVRARRLRHVSPAFAEDPLRVLRVARFLARLADRGFAIAPETLDLMGQLSRGGELAHLTPERVWLEVEKALRTASPGLFFQTLLDCGALSVVLPELAALVGKSQPPRYHPEGDAWCHTLEVLQRVVCRTPDPTVRFAALVHDLGKSATPPELLPHHYGHEERGGGLLLAMAQRLRIPNAYLKPALLAAAQHGRYRHLPVMRPGSIVKFLVHCQAFRDLKLFHDFLLVCEADLAGREEEIPFPRTPFLERCRQACLTVTAAPFLARGLTGQSLGEAITRERTRCVARVLAAGHVSGNS